MRRTRWLFLAAILAIVIFVSATYVKSKAKNLLDAPAAPQRLAEGVTAESQDWTYGDFNGTRQRVFIRAKSMRQSKDTSAVELQDVELHLFHKDGDMYDLVQCATASFNPTAKTLYSDGQVDITRDVPKEGPPTGRIVKIHSSGVTFESESGKATTDRPTSFEFDQGGGTSVGADYDPEKRELHLRSQVSLDWRGKTAESVPMHVESGEAYYLEKESKVILMPWAKLTRDTLHIEGEMSVVTIENQEVKLGRDRERARRSRRARPQDRIRRRSTEPAFRQWHEGGENRRREKWTADVDGRHGAHHRHGKHHQSGFRFVGQRQHAENRCGDRIGRGRGRAGAQAGSRDRRDAHSEKRIDHAEDARRRQGNRERRNGWSRARSISFPIAPGQPKRFMKGDQIWMAYGAENRIESFRSINVTTRTEKPPTPKLPNPPPVDHGEQGIVRHFRSQDE